MRNEAKRLLANALAVMLFVRLLLCELSSEPELAELHKAQDVTPDKAPDAFSPKSDVTNASIIPGNESNLRGELRNQKQDDIRALGAVMASPLSVVLDGPTTSTIRTKPSVSDAICTYAHRKTVSTEPPSESAFPLSSSATYGLPDLALPARLYGGFTEKLDVDENKLFAVALLISKGIATDEMLARQVQWNQPLR